MTSSLPLWKRPWILPCSALAMAALCGGAPMGMAHQMPHREITELSRSHRRALFRARKDWELRQQGRRRAIVRTQSRCIRRARRFRELARCQHAFDHAMQDLRREARQDMRATIRRLRRNERAANWQRTGWERREGRWY